MIIKILCICIMSIVWIREVIGLRDYIILSLTSRSTYVRKQAWCYNMFTSDLLILIKNFIFWNNLIYSVRPTIDKTWVTKNNFIKYPMLMTNLLESAKGRMLLESSWVCYKYVLSIIWTNCDAEDNIPCNQKDLFANSTIKSFSLFHFR